MQQIASTSTATPATPHELAYAELAVLVMRTVGLDDEMILEFTLPHAVADRGMERRYAEETGGVIRAAVIKQEIRRRVTQ